MTEKEEKGAIFSECRNYRYSLWRIEDSKKPLIGFIGLNPSDANETIDDKTVTRCRNCVKEFNKKEPINYYGGFYMINLFAYVESDPKKLKKADYPISFENNNDNNNYLCNLSKKVEKIIVCWGNDGKYKNRSTDVLDILKQEQLYCLGKNQTNEPRHPSRFHLPEDFQAIPYTRKNYKSNLK